MLVYRDRLIFVYSDVAGEKIIYVHNYMNHMD